MSPPPLVRGATARSLAPRARGNTHIEEERRHKRAEDGWGKGGGGIQSALRLMSAAFASFCFPCGVQWGREKSLPRPRAQTGGRDGAWLWASVRAGVPASLVQRPGLNPRLCASDGVGGADGVGHKPDNPQTAPLCDIPSGCSFFTGPRQSPVLPFACCVGALLSVGRCGRCSCWCRFRVRRPSGWCAGAVLNVAGCAVCASAAPNNWRI